MDSSDDDTFGEDSNINKESDLGEIDEIFEDDDDDLSNQFRAENDPEGSHGKITTRVITPVY